MSETIDPLSPGTADPAPPPASGAAPDWSASLPDDLKPIVTAKGWKEPADALRSYAEIEGLIGRKGLIPPKDGDPESVAKAWRAGLGVPDSAEGYTFTKPEGLHDAAWSADGVKAFGGWAHELGLTPAQAQGIAERFAKQQGEAMQRAAEGIGPDGRKMDDVLREAWGASYDAKVEHAKRAAKQFGADGGMLDALEAKVGGVAMMQMFARIGEAIGEDTPAGMGSGSGGGMSEKAELARYFDASTPEHAAYTQPFHVGHRDAQARVKELFARGHTLSRT